MKRIICLLIVSAIIISFSGCSNNIKTSESSSSTEKVKIEPTKSSENNALAIANEAYKDIKAAYKITQNFSTDVYTSWYRGIVNDEELRAGGIEVLVKNLNVNAEDYKKATYKVTGETAYQKSWDSLSSDEKDKITNYVNSAGNIFSVVTGDLYAFTVACMIKTYQENGDTKKIETYLDNAKTKIKDLENEFPEYKNIDELKNFYTTTKSLYDNCINPIVSLEQFQTIMNNYFDKAQNSMSLLEFELE